MLVPAMNYKEIAAQIKSEYHKICATTVLRLGAEYDRERRKLKVSKEALYPKEYEIKTAGKNNWIIFLHKGPGEKKYTGTQNLCFLCVLYYYSEKGLMAFTLAEDAQLAGFTSHFFKRYNERLCLNLLNPIDVVKAFFRKGMYCTFKVVERNNRPHIIAFGVDGIRFGEIKHDSTYVEWKTFVTRELAYRKQNELEHKLTKDLMREMGETEKEETYNPLLARSLKNRILALPMASRNIA
jgi:hypothetical protein